MRGSVGIEDGARMRPADIQFEDEAVETVGIRPVTIRFLNRFTGHVCGVCPVKILFLKKFMRNGKGVVCY